MVGVNGAHLFQFAALEPTSLAGSSFYRFVQPVTIGSSIDLGLYYKSDSGKRINFSGEFGITQKRAKYNYVHSFYYPMTGGGNGIITSEQGSSDGTIKYNCFNFQITPALDFYLPGKFIYIHIGGRAEVMLYNNSKNVYAGRTTTQTITPPSNTLVINTSQFSGENKADISKGNLFSVSGVGFRISKKRMHPVRAELNYFHGFTSNNKDPLKFKLNGIELRLGIKI